MGDDPHATIATSQVQPKEPKEAKKGFPLTDMGKGDIFALHCWQQWQEELHLYSCWEETKVVNCITPLIICDRVVETRTWTSHQLAMLSILQHPTIQRWGTLWCGSHGSLWCFAWPTMWKRHVVYQFRPRSILISLGDQCSSIPKVAPPTIASLTSAKQWRKLISKTWKILIFML